MTEAVDAESPLTAAHLQEIALADQRAACISGAVKLAAWNGWSFVIGAVCTAPFALADPGVLLAAAVLAASGYAELRGRKRLLSYDPGAPLFLCANQCVLLALTLAYVAQHIYAAVSGDATGQGVTTQSELSTALSALGDSQVDDLAGGMGDMFRVGAVIVYGAVGVLAVLFQGGSALYYFTRKKHLDSFLTDTPAWILELKRARA